MCNCHCGRCNSCGGTLWNNILNALENLFPAGGCGCNNGCGCNQNNGCGCNNNNGIALTSLDEFYIGPVPYAGNGNNNGCGCNNNNGCGCNNNNNGCGCGSNLDLSAYTACGNQCYDAYYARQYALIPNRNGCGICSCR